MKSQDETLEDWCRALLQALELEDVEIDVSEVLAWQAWPPTPWCARQRR